MNTPAPPSAAPQGRFAPLGLSFGSVFVRLGIILDHFLLFSRLAWGRFGPLGLESQFDCFPSFLGLYFAPCLGLPWSLFLVPPGGC